MKKVKKLIKCAFSAFLTAAMLCGCSDIGFGSQSMLRPPRATGNEAALQEILSEVAGSSYTLKYPQTGDYRSAVNIFKGEDDKEYAAALYSTENDSKMNISIMEHDEKEWKLLKSFSNPGVGVDRIIYRDINSDGKAEFIVGWTSYTSGINSLGVYSLENETVREMRMEETYSDLVITDLTGDKTDDIVLLSLRYNQTPSTAKLLQYSEQEKRPISKFAFDLDSEVTSFTNVTCGKIDSKTTGIVIDGENASGQYSTQVIYYDKKTQSLTDPLITETDPGQKRNITLRKEVITARDIDGDGVIEVPVISDMSAPKDVKAGEICSCTAWRQVDTETGSMNTKMNAVINYTDGYYFVMPTRWGADVTALSDSENRILTFYIWNSDTASLGDKLLEIHRFNRSDWDKAEQSNYVMLQSVKKNGREYIIAAQMFEAASIGSLNIRKDELENNVKLI